MDDTGTRTKLVDETGRTVDYDYDATYRLLNETITNDPQGTNGSIGYSYDDTGNRLSRTSTVSGISNQSASYDANDRPTSDTYDDNGNLLTIGDTTYRYDYANRLVSDGSITLTYDGDGNLVAQTVGGVTTTYLVDTQNPTGYAQIVEEQVNGQVQRTLTYGSDLISVNAVHGGSATPHFYGYDGLGTVRLLTDSAGTLTDRYEYEAFGGLLWQTGSTPNPHRFTGERFSSDLGLYYLRARWYNQGTGRFLTRDTYPLNAHHPIEWNRYVYTANNPVNAVDPSGHQLVGQVVVQEATTKKTRSLHAHQKGVQHARFLRYKRLGGSRAADAKRIQIRLRNSLSSDMDMKGVTIGRANSGGTKLISVSTDKAHIIQRLQTQNPGYEVIHPGHAFFRSRG